MYAMNTSISWNVFNNSFNERKKHHHDRVTAIVSFIEDLFYFNSTQKLNNIINIKRIAPCACPLQIYVLFVLFLMGGEE